MVDVVVSTAPIDRQRTSAPDFGGGEALARVGSIGSALSDLGTKLVEADKQTSIVSAYAKYSEGLDGLKKKYAEDTDHQTMEQRFKADADALTGQALTNPRLSQLEREQLSLRLQGARQSAGQEIFQRALTLKHGEFRGALDTNEQSLLQRAARGSETERQAAIAEYETQLAAGVKAGWLTAPAQAAKRTAFKATVADATALEAIRADPVAARQALEDPTRFPDLAPLTREARIQMARAAADERTIQGLAQRAKFDPVGAGATLGRVGPEGGIAIFERAVLRVEGGLREDREGNKVGLVSPAGALGEAQLMPDTARYVARRLGLTDVAQLGDGALQARLLSDHALNRRLGQAYFSEQLAAVDGSVPAALAAYNAGPGNAEKPRALAWHKQAVEKFGANYSAEQFISMIPDTPGFKETRNYIRKAYAFLGADTAGAGLTPGGSFQASAQIDAQIKAQEREREQRLKELAAAEEKQLGQQIKLQGDEVSAVIANLRKGYHADPGVVQALTQPLVQKALGGDTDAAIKLRDIARAEALAPLVREAWTMQPERLDAELGPLRTAQREGALDAAGKQRLEALEAVATEMKSVVSSFPIAAARRAGMVPDGDEPDQVIAAGPGDPRFAQALGLRKLRADVAAKYFGGASVLFSSTETAALRQQVTGMQDGQKIELAATLSRSLGDGYEGAAKALFGDDAGAVLAGRWAARDPGLAREIMRGQRLMALDDVAKKAPEVKAAFKAKLGADLYPSSDIQDQVADAAMALYAAERGRAGLLHDKPNQASIEKHIERITGPLVKQGGVPVPVPPGMKPRDFEGLFFNLKGSDLVEFGGTITPSGQPIRSGTIRRGGILKQLGLGSEQYVVFLPGPDGKPAPVMTPSGRPLVIDAPKLQAIQRKRGAQAPMTADEVADKLDEDLALQRMKGLTLPTAPPEPGAMP